MKLFRLFLFFGFGVIAAYSQGTPYDCFSVFSFTAASSQTGQNNASSQSPCVAWRVTYTTTGFSSATITFETSPDNSIWTAVSNTLCSSVVTGSCVIEGTNPISAGVQGTGAYRIYGKWVRVRVTSVTGSGSGQVVVYGYKGTSAAASPIGGGGGGSVTAGCTLASSIGFLMNGTNESDLMTTTLTTFSSAGGGCIYVDSGKTIRLDDQLVTIPSGNGGPVHITGDGPTCCGEAGSSLDLRYASGPGIWANGSTLTLDYITIKNTVNCQPLLKTTVAILYISKTTFLGSGTLKAACNDAIILGGTNAAIGTTIDSAFNGYGTVIRDSRFYNTQRILLMQSLVNGVVFAGNSNQGGNAMSQGPAIESIGHGTGTDANRANVIRDNIIEGGAIDGDGWSTTYNCGIKLTNTEYSVIEGNGYWDASSGSFLCGGASAIYNRVGKDNYLDITGATFLDSSWSTSNFMPWRSIPFGFDGGGSALSGTTSRCGLISFGGYINQFSMQADQSGNATVTVKTVALGSYTGPASASDISNGGEIMSAVKLTDTTLTDWTRQLLPNTMVCVVLSSPATITWLAGNIQVQEGR